MNRDAAIPTPPNHASANGRSCAILPAFNEAKTIETLVRQVKDAGVDPIVVNDGSTDDTAAVATKAGALVMNHLANRGKGAALQTGFRFATRAGYRIVVTLDADGQHDPAEIPKLLEAMRVSGAGMVIGARQLERHAMPPMRRWTNHAMSYVISLVIGDRVPDSQSGFRAIRTEVLKDAPLSASRFDLETELVLVVRRQGWAILSVPVRTIYLRGPSRIHPVGDGARFLWVVARHLMQSPHRPRLRTLGSSRHV